MGEHRGAGGKSWGTERSMGEEWREREEEWGRRGGTKRNKEERFGKREKQRGRKWEETERSKYTAESIAQAFDPNTFMKV